MKWILILLWLFPFYVGAQQKPNPDSARQNANIIITSSSGNIVKVTQVLGEKVTVYNYSVSKDKEAFLDFLEHIPGMQKDVRKILNSNQKITEVLERASYYGLVDQKVLNEKIGELKNIVIAQRLLLDSLRNQNPDPDLASTIELANKRLMNYDDEGYQKVWDDYRKNNLREFLKKYAISFYAQSQNNLCNFHNDKALEQADSALKYDPENESYLYLKALALTALSRNKESIDIYKKLLSLGHHTTFEMVALLGLGLAYHAMGQYDSALVYYSSSLWIQKEVLHRNDSVTAGIYNCIGKLHLGRGDVFVASKYFDSAYAIEEAILSPDSYLTATTLNDKGAVDIRLSKPGPAMYNLEKARAILEKSYGKNNPQLATCYLNIGSANLLNRDTANAAEYFSKAIHIQHKILQPQDPLLGLSWSTIGMLQYNKLQYDSSLKCYRQALSIFLHAYGYAHPIVAESYSNIGSVFKKQRQYDSCLKYYDSALHSQQAVVGAQHVGVADFYNDIGGAWFEKGGYDSSVFYDNKARVLWRKEPWKFLADTQRLIIEIASACILMGEESTAWNTLEHCNLSLMEKASHLNAYGMYFFRKASYPESIHIFLFARNFLDKYDSPKTNSWWPYVDHNLARAYCYEGQSDKALPLFEESVQLMNRLNVPSADQATMQKNYQDCKNKVR